MKMFQANIILLLFVLAPLAQAQSCDQDSKSSDIILMRDKLTAKLKVGTFHADLPEMDKQYNAQTAFMQSCVKPGRPVWQYCDSNCAYERGQYWLFKASDLPLLSPGGKLNDTPTSSAILMAAENGIQAIEEGRKNLFAESNSGPVSPNPTADQTKSADQAFNAFLKKDLAFATLLARFHMLVADNHYQAASSDAAAKLDKVVGDLIPKEAGAEAKGCSSRFCDAKARYEKAQWVLIEAKGSLPSSVDFTNEANMLRSLESDLKIRLNSIYSGQLFLGIDPYGFSKIPTTQLVSVLKNLHDSVKDIEDRVQAITKSWQDIKRVEESDGTQEQRYLSSEEINLKMYQIASLEQNARDFADNVKGDLDKLNTAEKDFAYRKQKREAEFQIEQMVKQSQFDSKQALLRRDQEMVALEMEQNNEHRAELRWLINYNVTLSGLQNQVIAFDAQLAEYTQRETMSLNRMAELKNRQAQNLLETGDGTDAHPGNIALQTDSLEQEIKNLTEQSTTLFKMKRQMRKINICDLERQAVFAGKPIPDGQKYPNRGAEDPACAVPAVSFDRAQYNTLICNARETILKNQIHKDFYIRKCLVGIPTDNFPVSQADQVAMKQAYNAITCNPNDPTEKSMAESLKIQRAAVNDARMEELKISKANMAAAYVFAQKDFATATALANKKTLSMGAVLAMAGAVSSTSAVPDTGTAGLGPYSSISARDTALANLEAAKANFDYAQDPTRDASMSQAKMVEIAGQAALALAQIQSLNDQATLDEMAAQQAIMQITQKGETLYFDAEQAYLQNVAQGIECQNMKATLEAEQARILAEHQKAKLDINESDGENALVANTITKLRNEQAILVNRRENVRLDNENLKLQINTETSEQTTIAALKAFVIQQQNNIRATIGTVQNLEEKARKITDDIAATFVKKFNTITKQFDITVEHLQEVLADNKTYAGKSIADLDQQLKNVEVEGSLTKQVTDNQVAINKQISTLRQEIQDRAGIQAQADGSRPTVEDRYLESSEVVAALTLGIPDYLKQKKNYLATVNYVLGHLRSRSRITGVLTNANPTDLPVYVNNAFDLDGLVRDLCTDGDRNCTPSPNSKFFDQTEVSIRPTEIKIPGNSGFLRTLNDGGVVTFNIGAGILDDDDMRESGHFSLGVKPSQFANRRDMYLMDIKIEGEFTCPGGETAKAQDFQVEHTGIGYVIAHDVPMGSNQMPETQFVIAAPRSARIMAFNENSTNDDSEFKAIDRKWAEHFTAATLPEYDLASSFGTQSRLPFMGAPVFGTYKIQKLSTTCPISKMNLKLIHNVNR